MHYILDAFNIIFCDDALEQALDAHGFQLACELLTKRLRDYIEHEEVAQIIAVFDGSVKAAHRARRERIAFGKIELVFTDPSRQADHEIIDCIESALAPGKYTVVTNDKRIIRRVTRAGARRMASGYFLKAMREAAKKFADPLEGEDPRKYHGVPEHEIKNWLRMFGYKNDEEDDENI